MQAAGHTEYKHPSCSAPQGGWEKEASNPPRFQHYSFWVFLFQIDHKSTFKNSKPAFLLLVPVLSFDFFLILSFLYVCAWLFFPFYTGKIRRQYYSALKSLCYNRFFSLKSNIGRYILLWWAYLNKSKQFLSSAEPKITTFSPLNCQKTCYHQNESSCLQSRKVLSQPNKNRFATELSWKDNAKIFFVPIYVPYADRAMENFT